MIWRKMGEKPVRAVLVDVSDSGAAFYIRSCPNGRLQAGEQIILRDEATAAESQIYKVMRIQSLGFGSVLAGCSRAAEMEVSRTLIGVPMLAAMADSSVADYNGSSRRVLAAISGSSSPWIDGAGLNLRRLSSQAIYGCDDESSSFLAAVDEGGPACEAGVSTHVLQNSQSN